MPATLDKHASVCLCIDEDHLAGEIVAALRSKSVAVQRIQPNQLSSALATASLLIVGRFFAKTDSFDFLERLRDAGERVPVFVVSSNSSVEDKIGLLRAGADDCLVEPFEMIELMARVDAIRRRAIDNRKLKISVGPLSLDLLKRTAKRGDRDVDLNAQEYHVLHCLMRRAGETVDRETLMRECRPGSAQDPRIVDGWISDIRRRITAPGENQLISTVRGVGFRLGARVKLLDIEDDAEAFENNS